ncbi:Agamous-like MADS-box protein AGL9-like protein [Hibiscus syriacus]|uniref:Agamous-like MADS-box protein AGL9-like protein n=1 Tax=Hibiscus syriacus TaxID=106335 RepID=A0A6A2Z6A9_HIBSY|nr:Agamous-like MADS-box protein AGL9-like protein [Hibiscus syriacus]
METTQKKKGLFKSKLPKSNPFSRLATKASSASPKVSPSTTGQNMAKVNYSKTPMVSKQPTGFDQHEAVSYFKSPSFYDHNGYANQTWVEGYQVNPLQLNPNAAEDVGYGRQPVHHQPRHGDAFFHPLDCEPTLQIGYQHDPMSVVTATGPECE